MKKVLREYIIKAVGVLLAISLIAYLIPSLENLSGYNVNSFFSNHEGTIAFKRSVFFALGSTIINVLFSLLIALSINNIPLNSKKGSWIALLIIPIMLGNVSIAFIGKVIFSGSAFFQQDSFSKFVGLTVIQFWQYGTLFVYLFWLNMQNIPTSTLNYAHAVKMSFGEKLKDLLLPACRNLAILLFILNFILSVYEDAKIQIIFKSSVGTHTELISQWLNRTYQSNSLISSLFANEKAIHYSITILFLALTLTIISAFIFSVTYNKTIQQNTPFKTTKSKYVSQVVPLILIAFIFLPLLYTIFSTVRNFRFDFLYLITPFIFTFLATVLAVLFSVLLGITLRLGWKKTLSSFNNRSLAFFILLFILQLIPPIVIYLTGFQWLKLTGYQSLWNLQLVWVAGHIILVLPLIISFVSVFHFRTSNNELSYMEAHNFSLKQIFKDSFLRRYRAEYLFTFLIGFSLIWNESVINNLLSDFIPSFVSEMKMNIEGRATNYAKGMNYLFVALGIALTAVWIWRVIVAKSFNQKNEIA